MNVSSGSERSPVYLMSAHLAPVNSNDSCS